MADTIITMVRVLVVGVDLVIAVELTMVMQQCTRLST